MKACFKTLELFTASLKYQCILIDSRHNIFKNEKIKMWKKKSWQTKKKYLCWCFWFLLAMSMFDLTSNQIDHFKSVLTWSDYFSFFLILTHSWFLFSDFFWNIFNELKFYNIISSSLIYHYLMNFCCYQHQISFTCCCLWWLDI